MKEKAKRGNFMQVELKSMPETDIKKLWQIGFSEPKEWMEWNAPYFEEKNIFTFEEFQKLTFYKSPKNLGVYVANQLVGLVSYHWEDERTKWLEIGGVIYDEFYWNKGIGSQALKQLISYVFKQYPDLQHIGLTTFSGNHRMMACALKLGMQQEACIRKVRFWKGVYYDSVKFGILRDEWHKQLKGEQHG